MPGSSGHGGHHGLRIIILVVIVAVVVVAVVLLVQRLGVAGKPAGRPTTRRRGGGAGAQWATGAGDAGPDLASRRRKAGNRHRREEPDQALRREGGGRRPELRSHSGSWSPASSGPTVAASRPRCGSSSGSTPRRRVGDRERPPYARPRLATARGGRAARGKAAHPGRRVYDAPAGCLAQGEPRSRDGGSTRCSSWSALVGRGKRVGEFSLGMEQRLGLRRRCSAIPASCSFDEPVNGLDPTASCGCASSFAHRSPPRAGRCSCRAI